MKDKAFSKRAPGRHSRHRQPAEADREELDEEQAKPEARMLADSIAMALTI